MLFTSVQSGETFYHPNPDEKIVVNRCSFLKKLISRVINEILKPYVEPPKTLVRIFFLCNRKSSKNWAKNSRAKFFREPNIRIN